MSKMAQIRDMPDSIHRILKSRAASAGVSLSGYLLRELKKIAGRPTMEGVIGRMHKRQPVTVEIDSARLIREDREAR
jgi:plasmid stability protein